jgi:putative ABC transport system permease protein
MRDAMPRVWLPRDLAREVFEPAYMDLLVLHQAEQGSVGAGRRHRVRCVLLYLDCWRLAITGVPARLRDRSRPRARKHRGDHPVTFFSLAQAFRRLRREPGFTTAAVLTLALGVGANVAVFAVVEAVLLRPLEYADPDRLLILNHRDTRTGITKEFIAIGDFVDIAERQTAFEDVFAYSYFTSILYGGDEPVNLAGLAASPGLLEALGARPVLGRFFEQDDARMGTPPVVILSWDLWQEQFGGDPAVIGHSERIGQSVRTIIGVAPAGFRFPATAQTDVILPRDVPLAAPAQRTAGWVFAVGRLKAGRSEEAALADLTSISTALAAEYPDQNQGSLYYAVPLRDHLLGDTRQALILLLAAVGFLLLIACANVANLQLARTLARRRETAVRLALGAGRGRLAAMFMSETIVLALIASVLGVLIATWSVRALITLMPESLRVPGISDVRMNATVLTFATLLAALASLVFGAIAAATVRLQNAADVLVATGRATMSRMMRRATSALVVFEVALAIVLLLGAGLILRSFAGLLAVDPGFSYDDVLTVSMQLPSDRYSAVESRTAFYAAAFERLAAIPGVDASGAAVVVPLTGNNWTAPFERADRPLAPGQRAPDVGWQAASGGYFRALSIPLLAGRIFDERDAPGSPAVVIISDAVRARFYAGEDPIGRRIRVGDGEAEIVGVVGDIRRAGLSDVPREDLYFPFESGPGVQTTLFLRASDPLSHVAAVRTALREMEPRTALLQVRSLADVAGESMRVTRLVLWLLGAFSLLALVLAAIGIYGVMSYVVRQRTHEIGTRMAVGATRRDIAWMVLKQGGLVAACGIAVGLVVGLGAARSLGSLLYGVSASDPGTIAAATAILGVIALVACCVPALRASGVDPTRALNR